MKDEEWGVLMANIHETQAALLNLAENVKQLVPREWGERIEREMATVRALAGERERRLKRPIS